MKIGCSTIYGLLTKPASKVVLELIANGINTIELVYEYPHLYPEKEIKLIKGQADYSMHCPFVCICFTYPNPLIRKPQIKLIEKSLRVAEKLEITHYVMHGGLTPSSYLIVEKPFKSDYFLDLFIKEFKQIFSRAIDCGIKIVLENLSPTQILGKPSDILYVKEKIPAIEFCFDIGHAEIYKQTAELLKLNIDYMHLHDNNLKRDEHLAIGKGKIKIKEILSKVIDKGFDGKIILECLTLKDCTNSVNKVKSIIKEIK